MHPGTFSESLGKEDWIEFKNLLNLPRNDWKFKAANPPKIIKYNHLAQRAMHAGTVFKLLIMNIHESSTENCLSGWCWFDKRTKPGPDLSLLVRAGQVLTWFKLSRRVIYQTSFAMVIQVRDAWLRLRWSLDTLSFELNLYTIDEGCENNEADNIYYGGVTRIEQQNMLLLLITFEY